MVHQPNAWDQGARTPYRNAVLTGIAIMMAMLVADRAGVAPGPAAAHASGEQQPERGTLMNAADQRKQMIAELARLNQAVSRLEAKIAKGLEVRVTDMPEVRVRNTPERAPADRTPAPGAGAPERP